MVTKIHPTQLGIRRTETRNPDIEAADLQNMTLAIARKTKTGIESEIENTTAIEATEAIDTENMPMCMTVSGTVIVNALGTTATAKTTNPKITMIITTTRNRKRNPDIVHVVTNVSIAMMTITATTKTSAQACPRTDEMHPIAQHPWPHQRQHKSRRKTHIPWNGKRATEREC
jgi:hypothetical protein